MLPVHRVIEQQAAMRGDAVAIVDGARSISYRDLNHAANALARRLMASGFRRGSHAVVSLPRSIDLGVILIAVLKAGGSYTWSEPGTDDCLFPPGISFTTDTSGLEQRWVFVDVTAAQREPIACSPNLPVLVRPTDIACVIPQGHGLPALRLPHATIATLRPAMPLPSAVWSTGTAALELWMALLEGATLVVEDEASVVAA